MSYSACPLLAVTLWAEPVLTWNDGSSSTFIILGEHSDHGKRFLSTMQQFSRATHHCYVPLTDHVNSSLHYTMCHFYFSLGALLLLCNHVLVVCVCVCVYACMHACSSDPCWLLPEVVVLIPYSQKQFQSYTVHRSSLCNHSVHLTRVLPLLLT